MALQRLLWAVIATALFLSPARAAMDAGDLICESSTTTGTGTLNLAGALTNYVTFASQITSGSVVPYHIIASDGKLEAGYGVYTDAGTDTMTRVASWSTDGSGAELTLPAGTHSVCVGPTAALFFNGAGLSTPHTGMDFQLDSDGTPLTALTFGTTFDGGYANIFDAGTNATPRWVFQNSEAGVTSPGISLYHNTATPADGDDVGAIDFAGEDDGGNLTYYAYIVANSEDVTNATEDGSIEFHVLSAAADLTALTLGGAGNISTFAHKLDTGAAASASLELTGTEAGAAGPFFTSYHNTATPANSDVPGALYIYGEDSGGGTQFWGGLSAQITDVTAASEDSTLIAQVMSGGSQLTALTLGTSDPTGGGFGLTHLMDFGSSDFPALTLQNSSGTTGGPDLVFYQNSASPTTGDVLGQVIAFGEDTASNAQRYGSIDFSILDATSTSEDSLMSFKIIAAGTGVTRLVIGTGDLGAGGLAIGPGGALNVDDNVGVYFYESEANGDNFKGLISAAANTADTTCTFENDANFIPDSCVGDGSDASDARLKDVIGPAGDVGGMIDGIKIYNFKWNTDAPEASEDIRKDKRGFGPLAQELFNINPDFVEVGGDDPIKDPWTWKPEKVVPYLIVEVQNLRKRLANQACYGIKLGNACIGVSM
jgi:hypothetical protein